MVFSYKSLRNKYGRQVLKPLIGVVLNYKKTHKITHPIMALIDSGADVCFCSDFIAKHLGVNLKKIKNSRTFTTANNTTFDAKLVKINLIFANKNYPCIFYITSSLPPQTPIILGQFGFFDQNKIIFDAQNKKITIT